MYMILTWVYIMESSSIRLRMFCIFLHWGLLFFLFADIWLDLKSFYLTIGSSLDSIEVDLNHGDVEVPITQECILEHFANWPPNAVRPKLMTLLLWLDRWGSSRRGGGKSKAGGCGGLCTGWCGSSTGRMGWKLSKACCWGLIESPQIPTWGW